MTAPSCLTIFRLHALLVSESTINLILGILHQIHVNQIVSTTIVKGAVIAQKIQKRGGSFEASLTKGIAKGPLSPRWLVFRCLDLREHHSDGDDHRLTLSEGCRSTFFVPTICLHQSLPSTNGFMIPTNCLY